MTGRVHLNASAKKVGASQEALKQCIPLSAPACWELAAQ